MFLKLPKGECGESKKMTTDLLLQNIFFGFWFIFNTYFFALWGFAIFISIVVGLIYLITRR